METDQELAIYHMHDMYNWHQNCKDTLTIQLFKFLLKIIKKYVSVWGFDSPSFLPLQFFLLAEFIIGKFTIGESRHYKFTYLPSNFTH